MIELKNVSAGYPGKPVLRDVDLRIPTGQITVLVGPNGCGKSTLMKTLVRLIPRESGEILVDGKPHDGYSPKELVRKIAYLPQNRSIPKITVQRLVLHGRFPYLDYPRRYSPRDREIVAQALAKMDLTELADVPLEQLSGGMRQKAYIAMALAQDTPAVLLDEPNAFLDIAHQLQLMNLAQELAVAGKAVLLVLHDLPMALRYGHRIAVMQDGRILDTGTPEEVFGRETLEQVFSVKVCRTAAREGWHYYCTGEGL